MEPVKSVTDSQRNQKFDSMLKVFSSIIAGNPPVDKVKEKLIGLQKSAQQSVLTLRQASAIYDRCKYYIDGTYGKGLSHPASS